MNPSELNTQFAGKSASDVLSWAKENFKEDIVIASSFGAEDVVLIDLAHQANLSFKVITLDTGRLPEETYDVMDRVRTRYKINIESYFPNTTTVEQLVRDKGAFSFRESLEARKECCFIRKAEPLKRALQNRKAWITGLRKAQSTTRGQLDFFQIDTAHDNILKINPLTHWAEDEVWKYIRQHKVPYNRLFDQGYRSIGCAPCTRAVKENEDERAGRWWWENPDQKECGIHRS